MARCPGSGARVRATVASAIQRLARGLHLVTPARARCWRLPWTEPDETWHAGQQRSRREIDLDIHVMVDVHVVEASPAITILVAVVEVWARHWQGRRQ